jgi:3-oxoacyl-[acyl-carrier-protein] synthase II
VGIVTALGVGWERNAEGFRAGCRAFRPVTLFDTSRQRVKFAAEVDLPEALPVTLLAEKEVRRLDRATWLLLLAAHEAWRQAGWKPSDDLPLVLGTTSGGMSMGEAYYRQAIHEPQRRRRQPTRVMQYQVQQQAHDLAHAFGFTGPVTIIANACASGANAVGHAWELLRSGQADRVLTGGYDALSQMVFAGFDSLQALSPTQCRPFDAKRDGLALGEGAALFALETLDRAQSRGATILGEVAGYGAVTDAHHLTQPHPEGDAALAAMRAACDSAQVTPDEVGYVNAHGTGTPLNDSAEAAALNRWAGARAASLPVSSTKASIGHLLGGAGAVEAAVCLMALREQWLPPTATLEEIDPLCAFPVVREPTSASFDCALTNSFGFGGANATLILRRWTR